MSGNDKIQFRWPWGYLWSFIALQPIIILAWAAFTRMPSAHVQDTLLYWDLEWLLAELTGARVNAWHGKDPEQIRTLSQLMQRIGQIEGPRDRWDKGWSGFISGYVGLLSAAGGWSFWGVGPAVHIAGHPMYLFSVLIALTIMRWLEYHFLRRDIYG